MEKITKEYENTVVTEETKLQLLIACANKINEIVEWINKTAIEKRVDRLEGIES